MWILERDERLMAKAKNKVIAGDHIDKPIIMLTGSEGTGFIKKTFRFPAVVIKSTFKKIDTWEYEALTADNVAAYELITDEHRKSAASGVARGLVGGALLGPVGMLAGGLSAKSKGIYQLAVEFKDGTKSLIEIDDSLYKSIIQACFGS